MHESEIHRLFRRCISELLESVFRVPWENHGVYACWLAQTYHFVRHTPVFLSLMAARTGGVDWPAHSAALEHLREELDHDKLLLQDLTTIGDDLSRWPEFLDTSLFYQSQYFWIDRFGPMAHAGYSLLLEGSAAQGAAAVADRVESQFGKGSARFLRAHSHVDDKHFTTGIERLTRASVDSVQAVLGNLRQSQALYLRILRSVVEFGAQPDPECLP
jgi:hypothetical protein